MSGCTVLNWCCNFAVGMAYPAVSRALGLGSSHGKPGPTWATHTWRNGLSEDPKAGAPIRDDSRADYVVYDHTTGGRCPGRPAGGSASHGGLLAQRGYAFFYGRPSGA